MEYSKHTNNADHLFDYGIPRFLCLLAECASLPSKGQESPKPRRFSFRRNQENQHCGPVADGAEEHKDVPDAVEIRPFVVGEEISAARVKQALKENAQQCWRGERQENRFGHKHHAPAHDEVEQQRKARETVNGRRLVDGASNDNAPKQSEHGPAQSAPHHADADGRVGRCNHHVDADVVENAPQAFPRARHPPVVERAAGIHHEHAAGEKCRSHRVLPTAAVTQAQNGPGRCQCEHHARKVRQRVENFFVGSSSDSHSICVSSANLRKNL